jgi:hypothetical protein
MDANVPGSEIREEQVQKVKPDTVAKLILGLLMTAELQFFLTFGNG